MSMTALLKLTAAAGVAGALVTVCARRAAETRSQDGSDGTRRWRPTADWRRWTPNAGCSCDCNEVADTVRGLEQEVAWLRRELEAVES